MVLSAMSKSNETAETRRKTQVNSVHEGHLDGLMPHAVKGPLVREIKPTVLRD